MYINFAFKDIKKIVKTKNFIDEVNFFMFFFSCFDFLSKEFRILIRWSRESDMLIKSHGLISL